MKSSNVFPISDESVPTGLVYDERTGFNSNGEVPAPENFLEEFLCEFGLKYHYKTNSVIDSKGKVIDDKLLRSQIRLYCLHRGVEMLRSYMDDAVRVWRSEQSKLVINNFKERLSYLEGNSDCLARYVEAVSGKRDPILIKVMEHFIWQVKCKLMGLPVEHHMLVCFYGKSGAGKSVAIQKLLGPVADLKLDSDFSIFNDKFGGRVWERNYVIFCDEMGDIQNTAVEKLKNIITSPRVEARGIRSDQILSVQQNATFITASNNELRDLIHDPTSARRYFQINCQDKVDWDTINELDYLALWQSVDENQPCPLLPVLDEVRAIQGSSVRAKCNIEQFLLECCEVAEFSKESPTTKELYNSFVEFCRMQGIRSFEGVQQFSRRLPKVIGELKLNASSKKTNRGTVWSVRLVS
jgi:ABC-type dipeptide/oligopeptide/nickel transport system ATPase component